MKRRVAWWAMATVVAIVVALWLMVAGYVREAQVVAIVAVGLGLLNISDR